MNENKFQHWIQSHRTRVTSRLMTLTQAAMHPGTDVDQEEINRQGLQRARLDLAFTPNRTLGTTLN